VRAVVKSGMTEVDLVRHLVGTKNKELLLSIPTDSHRGEILQIEIGLGLTKVVALV